MSVEIETYLRSESGEFTRIADVVDYTGDYKYVSGAIEFVVDGRTVLDRMLWDDVNDLWPYVIQNIDECLRTGCGEGYFPDQPILFRVERLRERIRGERLLFTVDDGTIHRGASGDRREVLQAVSTAALSFFGHLERLAPRTNATGFAEVKLIESWSTMVGGSSGCSQG